MELATERTDEEWNWGTSTRTVWDFRSANQPVDKATALPLLQVDYDVPGDLTGRVAAWPHLLGEHFSRIHRHSTDIGGGIREGRGARVRGR